MLNLADYGTFVECVQAAIALNENVITVPRKINSAWPIIGLLPAWPGGRLTIIGEGDNSLIWLEGSGSLCIPGCVVKLRDLRVYGNPANPPKVGVCFARAESGPRKGHSINGCQLRDVTVNGSFTGASVLVLCAEHSSISASQITNDQGHALMYDSNDRLGLGRITDAKLFTNTCHSLIDSGIAVWNMSGRDVFPLVISGFTDGFVGQAVHITAQDCRAYVTMESYPQSFGRGNVPRWNTLETAGWETTAEKAPKYGVLYRRLNGQAAYPETLRKLPALRWQTGPATGQETVA